MTTKSLVFAAAVGVIASIQAETWYQYGDSGGKGYGWDASKASAGNYWKDAGGNPATEFVTTDTYINEDGKTLRAVGEFSGGDVIIGDLTSPNYSCRLAMDGHVSLQEGRTLTLAVGRAYKNASSTSTYFLNATTVVTAPRDRPFGFILCGQVYHICAAADYYGFWCNS